MTVPVRLLAAVALVSWLVLPLVPLALWSVARGWFYPDLLPGRWTLDAWAYALSPTAGVLASLWQTAAIASAATALSLLVGLPAAHALAHHRFPGKAAVEVLILAPAIVPGLAVAFGLHAVFLHLGLAGSRAGVVLAHLVPTLPYTVLVLAAVLAAHDRRLEDQARSLGASPWQVFRHVTLPALAPGVMAAGLFAFLVSWSQYILTLVIGGGKVATLPLVLFNFVAAGRNDIAGAIGVIYVLPGIALIWLGAGRLTGRGVGVSS